MNLLKKNINSTWKFVHPDGTESVNSAGLVFAASGGVGLLSGRDSIKQALQILLSTRPGERVMRPEYGCDLHRIVFLQNTPSTAGLAKHIVRKAIDRFEKRVEIVDLAVNSSSESPNLLVINISYRTKSSMEEDQVIIHQELNQ